ncbi:MAG TPA: HAMP domain-containing sensor histidine kinase [Bacteroidales bacterium]|nr:HAMP domain-containing sensor histidine kinase [Bacteroidales bacterium]
MNKKKFIGLILLMVISLSGIIWVQVRWISNAVRVRNEQFDLAVANSLRNTAGMIETSAQMAFLNSQYLNSLRGEDSTNQMIENRRRTTGGSGNYSIHFSQSSESYDNGDIKRGSVSGTIQVNRAGENDSVEIVVSTDGKPAVYMKVPDSKADSTVESVLVSSDDYRQWLRRRAGDFQDLTSRFASEMYGWEKNLELDKSQIAFALTNELQASNIYMPFEFAILRGDSIYDGYFTRIKRREFLNSIYKVRLFANGIINKGDVISVVFPNRTKYVFGNMFWMVLGSLLFSLIIISTFTLSLYMIISQKKINEMKSDFINNMTHEFKTPIATISLAADTIANQKIIKDEEKVRHFVGLIKKENDRMNRQVENILQISTLEKKEMDFSFETMDLHEVIHHGIETISIQVHDRGGVIKTSLDAENSIVTGDREHLRNLVHNLLDNANKYSENTPEIKVLTRNNNYGIFLVVEDNGIGMTKAVQSKIFERFYRQTSGNIHNVKGFGLGLNYVKSIVDAHNGTISVESEPGCGSRFTVFIPFNRETYHE